MERLPRYSGGAAGAAGHIGRRRLHHRDRTGQHAHCCFAQAGWPLPTTRHVTHMCAHHFLRASSAQETDRGQHQNPCAYTVPFARAPLPARWPLHGAHLRAEAWLERLLRAMESWAPPKRRRWRQGATLRMGPLAIGNGEPFRGARSGLGDVGGRRAGPRARGRLSRWGNDRCSSV